MIAFCCTFFQVFNIPVFWPILVMYFITLFCITMKRQIKVLILFDSGSGFKKESIASLVLDWVVLLMIHWIVCST